MSNRDELDKAYDTLQDVLTEVQDVAEGFVEKVFDSIFEALESAYSQVAEKVDVKQGDDEIVAGDTVEITDLGGAEQSKWLGFKGEVVSDAGQWFYIRPLGARPDGYGLAPFHWTKTGVTKAGGTESKVTDTLSSITNLLKSNPWNDRGYRRDTWGL